mgnify:CR=1 FL=1
MKHLLLTTIAAVVLAGCGAGYYRELFTPEENNRFISACIGGDITTVKQSIADGLNVDISDGEPMRWAIWRGQKGVIKILIANGANVNLKQPPDSIDAGMTPLDQAAKHNEKEIADLIRENGGKHGTIHGAVASGNIEVVKEFLAAGADVNSKNDRGRATPLRIAASRGFKEIVELLIEKGADLNPVTVRTTPLDMANDPEIITILRKHGGKTRGELKAPELIWNAIEVGNIEAVKQYLANGVDVNARDENDSTPLHIAVWEGHKEIVELLISTGADVNANFSPRHQFNFRHSTALHSAAFKGHKEIAKLLIAAGADVNAKKQGGITPLLITVDNGDRGSIELFIAAGADVNRKMKGGSTPLHRASGQGQKRISEMLIAAGANVNAVTNGGKTPLDSAKPGRRLLRSAHKETADLLRKHGGKTGEELKAEGK